MKRAFVVVHSLGATQVCAETAAGALQKAFCPLGFRDACAVFDSELLQLQAATHRGSFRAFIGEPHAFAEIEK